MDLIQTCRNVSTGDLPPCKVLGTVNTAVGRKRSSQNLLSVLKGYFHSWGYFWSHRYGHDMALVLL